MCSLTPDAFTSAHNSALFVLCKQLLLDEGRWPSMDAVTDATMNPEARKRVGGDEHILECMSFLPQGTWGTCGPSPAEEAVFYSIESVTKWLIRRCNERRQQHVLHEAQKAVSTGRQADVTAILDSLYEPDEDNDTSASFRDLMRSRITALSQESDDGCVELCGIDAIDRAIGSWGIGDLVIIGGTTNSGKSTVMVELMAAWAERGIRTGYVSLEDGFKTLEERVISRYSSVPLQMVVEASGKRGDARKRILQMFSTRLRGSDEYDYPRVEVRRDATVAEVQRVMQRLVRRYSCRVLIVDYVHALRLDKNQDRRHSLAEAAMALKAHASRLGVPLILGSQLRRKQQDEAPSKSDLRDSGELEEKAEAILLTWAPTKGPRKLVVAKVKNGPSGFHIQVQYDESTGRITGFAREEPDIREFQDS
jgi:replicative DNA helicase